MNVRVSALMMLLLLGAVGAYTLTVTASDEVRIDDNLKVLLLLQNTSDSENVSSIGCTVYTLDRNNNTVDGPKTYDSVLNDPPGLKTNEGGRAYYSLKLSNRYPVFSNATLAADCAGALGSSSFYVLPYNNVDQVANLFLSLRDTSYSWIALLVGGMFVLVFLVLIGRAFIKAI